MRRVLILVACAVLLAGRAQAQVLGSGTATTNGDTVAVSLFGTSSVSVTITGTWTGTLTFRTSKLAASCAGLTSNDDVLAELPAAGTLASSTTGNGTWLLSNAGYLTLCVSATAAMTGTATVTVVRGYGIAGTSSSGGGGGGGTQYTEGATDASITGNAVMWEDTLDTLRAASATYPLPVSIISGLAITQYTEGDVDASITGNALMFETAGNVLRDLLGAAPADNMTMPAYAPFVIAILGCGHDGGDVDLCPQGDAGAGTISANTSRVTIANDDDVSDMATLFKAQLVANDAADAGAPLKVGFFAETSLSTATMVADQDRVNGIAGIDGVQIIRPYTNLEDRVSGVAAVTDGSSTSLVAAQGSGLRFCATTFIVANSSASKVTVDIRDGTGGTVLATLPAPTTAGVVLPLAVPLCTTANTAMATDPSAAASTVTTTAIGFKTKL